MFRWFPFSVYRAIVPFPDAPCTDDLPTFTSTMAQLCRSIYQHHGLHLSHSVPFKAPFVPWSCRPSSHPFLPGLRCRSSTAGGRAMPTSCTAAASSFRTTSRARCAPCCGRRRPQGVGEIKKPDLTGQILQIFERSGWLGAKTLYVDGFSDANTWVQSRILETIAPDKPMRQLYMIGFVRRNPKIQYMCGRWF